ncbi:MAG: tyrosine-type recombinase/integrase [Enterocloster asparagiformis]|nr:tyrosine-type recombinase/integrase [Enterocloster asparagiformis]
MRNQSTLKFLTPAETAELFRNLDQDRRRLATRNRAIIYLAKYCALRASEIGLIRLYDYDQDKHTLFCQRLKGSRNNTLKIVDPRVYRVVDIYYAERRHMYVKSPYLFLSQQNKPISRKTLHIIFQNYCNNTSIPMDKQHFHVLKHTRAMELINYMELMDVQWWLGHKNIANTMIYLEYTAEAKAELFQKLARYEGLG